MGHGPTASPTGKLEPAPCDQTVALSAGGHAGVRTLVRGLPAELAVKESDPNRGRPEYSIRRGFDDRFHGEPLSFSGLQPIAINQASYEFPHRAPPTVWITLVSDSERSHKTF